jgi:bifunctional non-homologous end joining protein LigD
MSQRAIAAPAVKFTHPKKIFFPATGFTKGQLIAYYLGVAPSILPHLQGRPITLIRYPDGVEGEKFYEKNAPRFAPPWLKTLRVSRRRSPGEINYILIDSVSALAWCANLAAIELHPFLHRAPHLDRPTSVVFDLDPGEGATLVTCAAVAFQVKAILDELGLEAFAKVSGSKGLQVYVPLNTPATYEATGQFAKAMAELLAQRHPDQVVSHMAKMRRRGRVLIDWSQNSPAKTTVAVYSLRGKRAEPYVSMPVTWAELKQCLRTGRTDALSFSPEAALRRLKRRGDLFAPVLALKQVLPKEFSSRSPASGRPLQRYQEKRDFTKTREPRAVAPRSASRRAAARFVIQKHAASHLHYDFRLEMDCTLKSWAVPKGMPTELGVKRSAFAVEDHPIGYLKFEGTIPAGQYGGGTVMVWDLGTYDLLVGSMADGNLKLMLHGKKLRGEWHLFKIRSDGGKDVWLVAKSQVAAKPLSLRQDDRSVLTGRSMAGIARANGAQCQSSPRSGRRARTAV